MKRYVSYILKFQLFGPVLNLEHYLNSTKSKLNILVSCPEF